MLLVTPSDCDLPKDTNLQNTYEAFMLIHLDTLPDAYLNITLSSHGTNAQLPNFIRPYTHNLVTQFCYSCNGFATLVTTGLLIQTNTIDA